MTDAAETQPLTRKDFASDQAVRWCPGCGDYAILAQVQQTLPKLGIPRENFVVVSGIGCSSRFPYYMNTYGIHSIHGRAPTLATGLKCARPDLQVWVVTGDGDSLAIGGNHFLHALRRNVDINILLFNNRIYGLTKGQYSPTSELGKRTKSSPQGSIENPVNPIGVAIGAEASFIARTVDMFQQHMSDVLLRAAEHRGATLVEIAQNCVIFNDGAWKHLTDPNAKLENVLYLEHGKPMRFGQKRQKGIRLNGFTPEVVDVAQAGEENLLVHDERAEEPTLAYFLSRMGPPEFPTPVGVFRSIDKPVHDQLLMEQVREAQAQKSPDMNALYRQGQTWQVPQEAT
jgi:2-oxoglutarate ferredoxin oxidoreductase subunit beta